MNPKPWGQRIRGFLEQLVISRHVRFLEAELIRVRLEKDALLRAANEQNSLLTAKIEKLELAIWPLASRAGAAYVAQGKPREAVAIESSPASSFQQALDEHNRKLQQDEAQMAKEN